MHGSVSKSISVRTFMFEQTTSRKIPILAVCGLVFAWGAGCDTQSRQDDFEDQAFGPPSGFVRTQNGTDIVAEDEDDWRPAPLFETNVSITPAHPNPVARSGSVSIPVRIEGLSPGRLYLHARDASGRLRWGTPLGVIDHGGKGLHSFNFNAAQLAQRGLQRLFILDDASALVSYGDVMVE